MIKPGGYAVWFDQGGITKERDTFTCKHCGGLVFVTPATPPSECGGYCGRCDAFICGLCADEMAKTLKCIPLERKMDELEKRDRFLRSAGLL